VLVVLDCNVLISAGLTDGTCRAVIREVVAQHRCVLSQEIFAEYQEVTARPKFASLQTAFARLLVLLESVSVFVEPGPSPFVLPDPDDEVYLAASLLAAADVLVTGNRTHFPEERYARTLILTPREFLDRFSAKG
jgi:uncharacterized protein